MAAEPINIFSHKKDLTGIVTLARQLSPGVQIVGPDDAWERITFEGAKSWFRKAPVLVIKHDAQYYTGPDWANQVAGMEGFFGQFPDVPRKPDIFRVIRTFRFVLATESVPDLVLESNDPRLKILFAVAQHLDGILFTPSGMWDASGRPLLCADGRSDASAVLPVIPSAPEKVSPPATPEPPATPPALVMPAAPVEPAAPAKSEVPAKPEEPKSTPTPAASKPTVEEEEPETESPDVKRVAKRALCLAAVSARGFLEIEPLPGGEGDKQRERILTWVGELALEEELEPEELDLLKQPVGKLPRQAAIDAVWRLEGLGILAWALGKFEVPAYDKLVDVGDLYPAIGFLNLNEATKLLASPKLRSRAELQKRQSQYFALHWRLRDFALHKKHMNFRTFARECWFGPLNSSGVRFCKDDVAIGDVPINKAPPEEVDKATSTANERHLAINWLVEGGEVYSETDTST